MYTILIIFKTESVTLRRVIELPFVPFENLEYCLYDIENNELQIHFNFIDYDIRWVIDHFEYIVAKEVDEEYINYVKQFGFEESNLGDGIQ